jgi:L-threonylcarbamoyladenylate synthase
MIVKVTKPTAERILLKAADVLKSGGIVAFPTETFYGLGVKYDLEGSLERLYGVKQRLRDKAMPLIIGSKELLFCVAESASAVSMSLSDRFWPGPLTLLFPARDGLSRFLTAGTGRVAVRIPGESFALDLTRTVGFPITATSANPSGSPPALDAETVKRYFGDSIDLIVDAGAAPGGLPSTIVNTTGDTLEILRKGAVSKGLLLPFLKLRL